MSQFTKVPVGEYMLRFGIGCASDQFPIVEHAVDEIVKALQAKGPTAAELEKVTRTWLNEQDARTKTNDGLVGAAARPCAGSGPRRRGRGLRDARQRA